MLSLNCKHLQKTEILQLNLIAYKYKHNKMFQLNNETLAYYSQHQLFQLKKIMGIS